MRTTKKSGNLEAEGQLLDIKISRWPPWVKFQESLRGRKKPDDPGLDGERTVRDWRSQVETTLRDVGG